MKQVELEGKSAPHATMAEVVNGAIQFVDSAHVFGRGRVLVIGVPGAFAPICTREHVPNLVANSDRLHRAGFDELYCVSTSDPFAIEAWSASLDPTHSVRFLSDGSLAFARSLGLVARQSHPFLGERSERYLLTIEDGVIRTARVEPTPLQCVETKPETVLL